METNIRKCIRFCFLLFAQGLMMGGLVAQTSPAIVALLTPLKSFADPAGTFPYSGVIQASDGNFYGTTTFGGSSNLGTVFMVTPQGIQTTLCVFTGANGGRPYSGLIQGSDGNLYGLTFQGGSSGQGTAFRLTLSGQLTTLCSFAGANGANPIGKLMQGLDGSLYGTTSSGGSSNLGVIFKMTSSGVLTTLINFTGTNGALPYSGLLQGRDGNLYGTTRQGGSNNGGTVYKLSPSGVLTTVANFTGSNGQEPLTGGLVQGKDGNFYGTTSMGGSGTYGTVFKVTPSGALTTLCSFTFLSGAVPGAFPYAPLIQGNDGDFYGTTSMGGAFNKGTIFKISPSGSFATLCALNGTNGSHPYAAGLTPSNDGNFYGTTQEGGSNDQGVFYRLTPFFLTGTVGSPFSYQITAINSPTSYSATNLPAGLSVNRATGLISGTPTVAGGSMPVSLLATNASGTGTGNLWLTIQPLVSNLGLNRPATASSFELGNLVSYANDGNTSTRWASGNALYPQWWQVDLGAPKMLTRVDVNWYKNASRAYQYTIQISSDNVNYTPVVDHTMNVLVGSTSDSFSASARYVRINVTGCSAAGAFASAYEIGIFGY